MKTVKISVIIGIIMMLSSCSTDYLEETPPNLFSSETLLQNYNGFEAMLNGLYNVARHARWQSEKIENAINGVDNFCSNRGRSEIMEFWGSSNSPDDTDLEETWAWLYEIIANANNLIFFADNPDVDWAGGVLSPEENKNVLVAHAKALRAWAYRRLAWSWGDVPLSLDPPNEIKTDWQRAPIAQVRQQIISDLKWAQQYIPSEDNASSGSLQGRITKGAVQTFLAETYLAIGKPDSALYWCDQVIDNPAYQLVTERYGVFETDPSGSPFGDMFKHTPNTGVGDPILGNENRSEGNTEALWVWQFKLYDALDNQGHEMSRATIGEYNLFHFAGTEFANLTLQFTYARGGRGKNYFNPTRWWVLSYEDQDDRAQNYIMRKSFILKTAEENDPGNGADRLPDSTWSYGDTVWLDWSAENDIDPRIINKWTGKESTHVANFPYSRKGEGTDPADMQEDFGYSDQIYLRLADTYLLKAEALFKLGRPAEAADVINIIRERSNATPITGADVTLDFILDERSRELIVEEDRRYTLVRTHKWYERTSLHNHNGGQLITERDTLFPIPQTVIDANLTAPFPQNPGW